MYAGKRQAAICPCFWRAYNLYVSRVSGLYRLQEIDLELDKLNVRLDEIEAILQDSSEIQRLQGELARSEAEFRSRSNAAQSAEHAVASQRSKIASNESKLYGGQVQNPKELQDLQAEQESLKRHLETLEDRLLEEMLAQDEAEQIHSGLEHKLEQAQAARSATQTELADEQAQVRQKQQDLMSAREAAANTIAQDDLDTYQRLRERLNGVAIATLKDDSCSECGLTLSAATQQAARSGNELVKCSQCRRLLYGG